MTDTPLNLDQLDVEITPEPSPEERAAILFALRHLLARLASDRGPVASPWSAAGRRESLLGRTGGSCSGWGRTDRVTDC